MKNIRKITAFLLCLLTVFSVLSVSAFAASKPSAPTKAKVTAVSADSAALSWNAVQGVDGYRIYVNVNGKWKVAKDTTKTSVVVTGLKASKTYTFAVKSIDIVSGNYVFSDKYASAKAKTTALTSAVLSGTAGTDRVSLTWTKVPGASGYAVYRYSGNSWICEGVTEKPKGTIKSLKGATTYHFAVVAYSEGDGKVVRGPSSNYLKIKTVDPNKVTVKCVASNESAVKLAWTKADSTTGYRIYRNVNGVWTVVGDIKKADTLNCVIKNLDSDTEYEYRVRAFRQTASGVTWYQASDVCKAVTAPGVRDIYVHRVDQLKEIFNSYSYTFSYTVEDDKYGAIPVTVAKNGDEYYLSTKVNERPYVLLNKTDGSSYILLEENKVYIKVPALVSDLFDVRTEMNSFMPSEDWEATASIVTFNSQKVVCESFTNPERTRVVKFYFKTGKLIAVDEISLLGLEERAVIKTLVADSDGDLFEIPYGYTRLFYGSVDSMTFAIN